MRLTLLTVGKPRDKHVAALADDYGSRIARYGRFEHLHVKEARRGDPEQIKADESAALLAAAPSGAVLVALDERGEQLSSLELARRLDKDMLHGRSHWALFIGGAFGHAPLLRERCDWTWSLSPLTLAHDLAHLVVLEQLYRAFTILRGEPYHKA